VDRVLPANFTDPDGRFSLRIGDMIVQATVQLGISISQVDKTIVKDPTKSLTNRSVK
jgi:hypothetical protein